MNGVRSPKTGVCLSKNPAVHVTSIDGSSYLKKTLSDIIKDNLSKPSGIVQRTRMLRSEDAIDVTKIWEYKNYAVIVVNKLVRNLFFLDDFTFRLVIKLEQRILRNKTSILIPDSKEDLSRVQSGINLSRRYANLAILREY